MPRRTSRQPRTRSFSVAGLLTSSSLRAQSWKSASASRYRILHRRICASAQAAAPPRGAASSCDAASARRRKRSSARRSSPIDASSSAQSTSASRRSKGSARSFLPAHSQKASTAAYTSGAWPTSASASPFRRLLAATASRTRSKRSRSIAPRPAACAAARSRPTRRRAGPPALPTGRVSVFPVVLEQPTPLASCKQVNEIPQGEMISRLNECKSYLCFLNFQPHPPKKELVAFALRLRTGDGPGNAGGPPRSAAAMEAQCAIH